MLKSEDDQDMDDENDENDEEEDDEDDEDDEDGHSAATSAHLRSSLKIIRDPSKNAFDLLPSGESLGSFANRHAVDRHRRKVDSKRERARESRLKKRKQSKLILRRQEKISPVYGRIAGASFARESAHRVGTH